MLSTAPRDPAALPRLLITVLALLLLWPGISLSELDLAVLVDGDNTRAMGNFLAGFWPPAHDGEFLALLGRAALREPYWPLRAASELGVTWRDAPYPEQYTRGAWDFAPN